MKRVKSILSLFLIALSIGFTIPTVNAQTRTITTNTDMTKINPSGLNFQRQRYAVFEIQFPNGKSWSDFELKGSISNFNNQYGSDKVSNLSDFKNKVLWDKKSESQKNAWFETNITSKPDGWSSMSVFDKEVWLTENSGPYIFFFSTILTYDTHYLYGKNDGNLRVYFAASNYKGASDWDPRQYMEYHIPKVGDRFYNTTISTNTPEVTVNADGTRYFRQFQKYIEKKEGEVNFTNIPSGEYLAYYTSKISPDTANTGLQKYFSINNLYTFQSLNNSSSGQLNSIIVIVCWGDPNESGITNSEKVFRTVMDRQCTPTNKALKWCYILSSSNAFEMTFYVTDNGNITARRVYRAIRPIEWINYDQLNEYVNQQYSTSR